MKINFLVYRFNSQKKSRFNPSYASLSNLTRSKQLRGFYTRANLFASGIKYDSFKVPYNKGMTVLDVILYIYKHLDPTLAFRYECRQGICGTCGVMLNKKPVLSCSTQIDTNIKTQMIEPLANFPVEKDLVVNIEPVLERYMEIKPYMEKIKKKTITKKIADKSKSYRKCIECGCCIAVVPELTKTPKGCLDPMALVKIARYVTDPRDGLNRKSMAKKGGIDKYSEELGKKLSQICPRGIPIDQAIELLKK